MERLTRYGGRCLGTFAEKFSDRAPSKKAILETILPKGTTAPSSKRHVSPLHQEGSGYGSRIRVITFHGLHQSVSPGDMVALSPCSVSEPERGSYHNNNLAFNLDSFVTLVSPAPPNVPPPFRTSFVPSLPSPYHASSRDSSSSKSHQHSLNLSLPRSTKYLLSIVHQAVSRQQAQPSRQRLLGLDRARNAGTREENRRGERKLETDVVAFLEAVAGVEVEGADEETGGAGGDGTFAAAEGVSAVRSGATSQLR